MTIKRGWWQKLRGKPRSVALALGSGGARGLAHIPVLEAFDELGIKPAAIAGASIGAVVGAGYAAGMSGREIRAYAEATLHDRNEIVRRLLSLQFGEMREQFSETHSLRGLVMQFEASLMASEFLPAKVPETFEALKIPLFVIATDFWKRKEMVFRSGPLKSAIAGSMAIPGVLRPVIHEDRVLIDGGTVNPLPFDILRHQADIVVAVDITPSTQSEVGTIPEPMACLFLASHIMTHAIVSEKLRASAPDLLPRPDVNLFGALDFLRAADILRAADPIKEETKRRIGELLG